MYLYGSYVFYLLCYVYYCMYLFKCLEPKPLNLKHDIVPILSYPIHIYYAKRPTTMSKIYNFCLVNDFKG